MSEEQEQSRSEIVAERLKNTSGYIARETWDRLRLVYHLITMLKATLTVLTPPLISSYFAQTALDRDVDFALLEETVRKMTLAGEGPLQLEELAKGGIFYLGLIVSRKILIPAQQDKGYAAHWKLEGLRDLTIDVQMMAFLTSVMYALNAAQTNSLSFGEVVFTALGVGFGSFAIIDNVFAALIEFQDEETVARLGLELVMTVMMGMLAIYGLEPELQSVILAAFIANFANLVETLVKMGSDMAEGV